MRSQFASLFWIVAERLIFSLRSITRQIDNYLTKAGLFKPDQPKRFVSSKGICKNNFFIGIISIVFLQVVFPLQQIRTRAKYTPQTPLATQFEKYINYPVDHSTGAASIQVPLYTLKAGNIEVPVNLSYHTAEVKPSDGLLIGRLLAFIKILL